MQQWAGTYNGQWKANKKDGLGVYLYANGDKYKGEWKNDQKHGLGAYVYANKDRFEGEFSNGQMNGQGQYTFHDSQDYIVGRWLDDVQDGVCVFHNHATNSFRQETYEAGEKMKSEPMESSHPLVLSAHLDAQTLRSKMDALGIPELGQVMGNALSNPHTPHSTPPPTSVPLPPSNDDLPVLVQSNKASRSMTGDSAAVVRSGAHDRAEEANVHAEDDLKDEEL